MKCPHCLSKIHKDDEICKNCGMKLYVSQFADESRELEEDMSKISHIDIECVANQMRKHKDPLTYEDFEKLYYIKHPLPRIGRFVFAGTWEERRQREKKIKHEYEQYLYTFDGEQH